MAPFPTRRCAIMQTIQKPLFWKHSFRNRLLVHQTSALTYTLLLRIHGLARCRNHRMLTHIEESLNQNVCRHCPSACFLSGTTHLLKTHPAEEPWLRNKHTTDFVEELSATFVALHGSPPMQRYLLSSVRPIQAQFLTLRVRAHTSKPHVDWTGCCRTLQHGTCLQNPMHAEPLAP